jgi:hypothetical protein
VPVKVVSERLGHANATITLTVYQHVHPGMGREAANRFAGCSRADPRHEVSRGYHEGLRGPDSKTPRAPDLQEHRGEAVSEGRLGTYAHGSRLSSDRSVLLGGHRLKHRPGAQDARRSPPEGAPPPLSSAAQGRAIRKTGQPISVRQAAGSAVSRGPTT